MKTMTEKIKKQRSDLNLRIDALMNEVDEAKQRIDNLRSLGDLHTDSIAYLEGNLDKRPSLETLHNAVNRVSDNVTRLLAESEAPTKTPPGWRVTFTFPDQSQRDVYVSGNQVRPPCFAYQHKVTRKEYYRTWWGKRREREVVEYVWSDARLHEVEIQIAPRY